MSGNQRFHELEFELALTANLEEIYGLLVRSDSDPLNRRKAGYTNLCFRYEYGDRAVPSNARVGVRIEGSRSPVYRFKVDLESPDSIEDAAAACEELAFGIRAHLDAHPLEITDKQVRRREDD